MASLDREIDRLYQLPLAEFTKARDELAKREAADRAAIRRLEKPTLPAWAVNQLYWRDRDVYEGLTAAAERLRKAQVATLSGKSGDVDRAEAEHQAARKAAAERIRSILADSGAAATSVTLTAINETLDALPTRESPGRLLRPLKPMGFEGLAGLLKSGKIPSPRADVLPFKKPSPPREGPGKAQTAKHIAAQAEKDARRHVMERKKKAAKLTAELRTAEAGERAANAALAKTRLALAKAEHDHQQAAASLEASAARVEELNREARASERRASQAAIARADLEGQLKALATDHP